MREVRGIDEGREGVIYTTAGELRLTRNYHYCTTCKAGFAPRDEELKLPVWD